MWNDQFLWIISRLCVICKNVYTLLQKSVHVKNDLISKPRKFFCSKVDKLCVKTSSAFLLNFLNNNSSKSGIARPGRTRPSRVGSSWAGPSQFLRDIDHKVIFYCSIGHTKKIKLPRKHVVCNPVFDCGKNVSTASSLRVAHNKGLSLKGPYYMGVIYILVQKTRTLFRRWDSQNMPAFPPQRKWGTMTLPSTRPATFPNCAS